MSIPFGHYLLLRRLATGGMGEVFLARPKEPSRAAERLVIKRILPHLAEDSEFRDMFLDEARIATQLNHPNLVRIFEVGEVGDSVYLAMEYVRGEDLRSVERAGKLKGERGPLAAAAHIVAAAAAGLEHAHGLVDADGHHLNLVHRDVSPQNILVGFASEVKLIDFGVAKAAGLGQPTITGVLKGKCAYMSPEQAAGDAIDARSDVFSLGVVWWELLTGRRLFKGSSDQMTMRLVLNCQVPAPSRLNPELPAEVDALTAKVLTKQAVDRFQDARSFRVALEEFIQKHGLASRAGAPGEWVQALFPDRVNVVQDEEGGAALEEEPSDKLPGPLGARGSLSTRSRKLEPEENTVSVTRISAARSRRRWLLAAAAWLGLALGTLALLVK